MRLAILADIHGNLPALHAVMAELERLQPDGVVVNGDLINAVPFSAAVIDEVRQRNWVAVRGNHEFYYLDFDTPRAVRGSDDPARWGHLHWLMGRLSPEQGAYLAMLPDDRTFYVPGTQPLRVAHGVPGRNRVGFYNEQPAHAIAVELGAVQERTLISAHTHVQVDRHVAVEPETAFDLFADPHEAPREGQRRSRGEHAAAARHWHVINPGSVGLPLNGDPRAQFAVIESVPEHVTPGGWRASHHRVAYDRRPALDAYTRSGMLEAGGVITQLFYWELVTAQPEIVAFNRWAREAGLDVDGDLPPLFEAYCAQTGRDAYVRGHDPLMQGRPG